MSGCVTTASTPKLPSLRPQWFLKIKASTNFVDANIVDTSWTQNWTARKRLELLSKNRAQYSSNTGTECPDYTICIYIRVGTRIEKHLYGCERLANNVVKETLFVAKKPIS